MQVITDISPAQISRRARKKWAAGLIEKARAAESQGNKLVVVELRINEPAVLFNSLMESVTDNGSFTDPFI